MSRRKCWSPSYLNHTRNFGFRQAIDTRSWSSARGVKECSYFSSSLDWFWRLLGGRQGCCAISLPCGLRKAEGYSRILRQRRFLLDIICVWNLEIHTDYVVRPQKQCPYRVRRRHPSHRKAQDEYLVCIPYLHLLSMSQGPELFR